MPTDRPRHTITETDEIAEALDDAARHWPTDHDARGRLLVQLVKEGHRVIVDQHSGGLARRRKAIQATSGALTGLYPEGYLDELRGDWPE